MTALTISAADWRPRTGIRLGVDISFTNAEGGSPGDDAFNPDAYLSGVEKLAELGVTWLQVGLPGDSLAHLLDTIERFGKTIIQAR